MLLSLAGNDLCRIAVAPRRGSVNLNAKTSFVSQPAIRRRSPYGERESKYTDILHVTLGLVAAPHTGSVNLNLSSCAGHRQRYVAPHTGSVNLNWWMTELYSRDLSRSPYGERESKLPAQCRWKKSRNVVPRTGSVNLNICIRYSRGCTGVAPHTGSVNLNTRMPPLSAARIMSLPIRGAWI